MKEYKTDLPQFYLVKEKTNFKRVKISSSENAAKYAYNFYKTDIEMFESAFILLLNQANNTIGYVKISQGGITGTVVDVRIIAKYAVESLCASVILFHNHPSGTLSPSGQDKELTKKLKDGLMLLDIKLLDHIILVPCEWQEFKYYSFTDENLI